jgi:hypothetical protein
VSFLKIKACGSGVNWSWEEYQPGWDNTIYVVASFHIEITYLVEMLSNSVLSIKKRQFKDEKRLAH